MLALALAVVVASVLGSLHCAGMCGAFVAIAVGLDGQNVAQKSRLIAAYNLGRLITYVALGAIAGAVGQAIDLGAQAAGLQRAALTLAAATMILIGLGALAASSGVRLPRIRPPRALDRAFKWGLALATRYRPTHRALAIGLMTTLLPCGWLYAFALLAASTTSPLSGAVVMAAFWLGTLPLLVTLGAGIQSIAGPLRRHVPTVIALCVVVMGFWTLFGRLDVHMPSVRLLTPVGDASGMSEEARLDAVRAMPDTPPPCCAPDG